MSYVQSLPARQCKSKRLASRLVVGMGGVTMRRIACVSVVLAAACPVECFSGAALSHLALARRSAGAVTKRVAAVPLRMQVQNEDKPKSTEEVTKKYGLEAGVFTALT